MEILEVTNNKLMRLFIEFPLSLYKGNSNFVPQLYIAQEQLLSSKNPFFEHSQAAYFLAQKDGDIVGRIAVINNKVHNEVHKDNCGFFGFFEVVENFEIAKLLLDKAMEWLEKREIHKIIGPTNLTTNDSCGMLISGFDLPPCVLMPYNMDYYNQFLIQYGFIKEMDLFSYEMSGIHIQNEPMSSIIKRIDSRLSNSKITFRTINFKKFDQEIMKMREVYNLSNKDNWGFIPLNEKEFRTMALDLKSIVSERLIIFAEKEGQIIGFIVALPDFNQVFKRIPSGRLLPLGLLKLLYFRRKIDFSRVLILGLLKEFRNTGIDLILYKKIRENLGSIGIFNAEACYVMESNKSMNSILLKIGGKLIKKYRIYKFEMPIH